MLALIILSIIIIYFAFLVFMTKLFYRKAKNKWKSKIVASLFGLLGFLLVFLPIFWDVIPNRIYFNYLCKNDTKLQVYKTFEEWNAENPGVFETLHPLWKKGDERSSDEQHIDNRNYIGYSLNQRVGRYNSSPIFEYLSFNVKRSTAIVYDYVKGDILAIQHSIYSGPGNPFAGGNGYKVWLNSSCENNEDNSMHDFAKQFKIFSD